MIHIDFLVEDISGKVMLENLLPKIIPSDRATYKVNPYKGIGRLPSKKTSAKAIKHRQLLDLLPKLLNGFGHTYNGWGNAPRGHVVVVCDLDDNNLLEFKQQLESILEDCYIKPNASFCFAIEEGEAWFLGDKDAIKSAYPNANLGILNTYEQDSICGTWEKLADVVGFERNHKEYQEIGAAKRKWAETITPFMDLEKNQSPSFQYFVSTLNKILSTE
ncbi:DUF4276 family protein [Megasphaera sp. An286]|uniref:DUF4276 family protein n=1 Tax=Megasphaera sp. An286 TaxID=1965622 RepID=UPI00194F144D|nr:DUF4276 family protein [Megasphaera sp. An286]